jgi:hypothetical protein
MRLYSYIGHPLFIICDRSRFIGRTIILCILLFLISQSEAHAVRKGDVIVGFKGGYSQLLGHYDSRLDSAGYYGLYVIPFVRRFLMGEADLAFARYPLKDSEGSYLYSSTLSAGPLLYYRLYPFLQPYAGLSATVSYLYLNAERQDIQENTYKVGFALKAGLFIPLAWGIMTRIGVEYTQSPLSGEYLNSYNLLAGVSFNYYSYARSENIFENNIQDSDRFFIKIDRLYIEGVEEFDKGEYAQAKERFNRVTSLKDDYKDTRSYLERIEKTEKLYSNAVDLIAEKKYVQAIPLLEQASPMRKARDELIRLRLQLSRSGLVKQLEKQGIKAYEGKEYQRCIVIMERIQLIESGNRVVGVYLPRARKRYEALQRLKLKKQ